MCSQLVSMGVACCRSSVAKMEIMVKDTDSPSPPSTRFLIVLKDYWFLVALGISIVTTVAYMILFEVHPWDAHTEAKNRREQTAHHATIGRDLLERGEYRRAKEEFERALALHGTNESALTGRYLSELFLDMQSADWNPAIGLTLSKRLGERFKDKSRGWLSWWATPESGLETWRHIVDKYLGDLDSGIDNPGAARLHYEAALSRKKSYLDALDSYYGLVFIYWMRLKLSPEEKLQKLVELGNKMIASDSHDHRGLHKLGIALYEQALEESSSDRRRELLDRATEQSERARNLKFNDIANLIDLGQIIRAERPSVSLWYHERAADMLESKESLPSGFFIVRLFKNENGDQDRIEVAQHQIKAWVVYNIALDHLAIYKATGQKQSRVKHQRSLAAAIKLDIGEAVRPVYDDGLKVLEMLLSEP